MRELLTADKKQDKIEQIKQQIAEIQKLFSHSIQPKKNHTLYEINLLTGKIVEAEFDEIPPIKWEDAVKQNYSLRRNVTRKDNCVYIPALNIKNVIKLLKRDYNITLTLIPN